MSEKVVSAEKVISVDRQKIFDALADPRQHAQFDGSGTVQEAKTKAPERLELGSKFGMSMKWGVPYPITNTVVEFEEGERIAWRHFGRHIWRYELEDVEGGTKVTESFDWSKALMGFGYPLCKIPQHNLGSIKKTLDRLAEYVG